MTDDAVVLTETITLPMSGAQALLVTLNRPTRLNCFNTELCDSLSRIFSNLADQIQAYEGRTGADNVEEPVVAVILTGAGNSFCAGADLSNPPNPLKQSSDLIHDLVRNPVHQMNRITVPIIGAVQGHCITGGFELALTCDILVGNSTTKFKDTHVKFGLAPCWGLSQRLQRRIGSGRAKLISFTASSIDGTTAFSWGLLDDFVTSTTTTVLERATEIADTIGANDAVMVRRYKRALVEGGNVDLGKGLQRERELGFAHYLETMEGNTFQNAKGYIEDETRTRSRL